MRPLLCRRTHARGAVCARARRQQRLALRASLRHVPNVERKNKHQQQQEETHRTPRDLRPSITGRCARALQPTHTEWRACVHARARTAPGGRQPDEGAGRRIPARWRGRRGRGEERRRRRVDRCSTATHRHRHHMHVHTHTHTRSHTLTGRHLPVVQTGLSRPDSAQGSRSPWCSRCVRDSRWKLPQRPSTERCRAARMNTHKHSSKIK